MSPVFLYEAITASRRWQGHALRALLVLAMLITLGVVWLGRRQGSPASTEQTRQFLAELGENFYYGAAGVQLALALLAAPAATAGAVCLDRARGWLAHMFVDRYRAGQRPPLKEYTDRYPEHAAEIREVFPALAMLENIALPDATDVAARPTSTPRQPELHQIGDFRILREIGQGGMGIV